MALDITLKQDIPVPVEVEGFVPEAVRTKSLDEIRRTTVFVGNREIAAGDVFDMDGNPADSDIVWNGDLSGVHWIGAKMTQGKILVRGNAGRHLGSEMSGGQIDVEGDAGDWVGGEMRGGTILVRGRAGHLVGAAYRGSRRGMTGGTILIGGDAGNEIGHTMRRGLIAVAGNCGDLIGFNMLAGTVLAFGDCGIRHGAGMRRGTLGLLGPVRPELLPSYRYACQIHSFALLLVLRELVRREFPFPSREPVDANVDLFHGDLIEGGRGEILLPARA